jgi:hypothetical protein
MSGWTRSQSVSGSVDCELCVLGHFFLSLCSAGLWSGLRGGACLGGPGLSCCSMDWGWCEACLWSCGVCGCSFCVLCLSAVLVLVPWYLECSGCCGWVRGRVLACLVAAGLVVWGVWGAVCGVWGHGVARGVAGCWCCVGSPVWVWCGSAVTSLLLVCCVLGLRLAWLGLVVCFVALCCFWVQLWSVSGVRAGDLGGLGC